MNSNDVAELMAKEICRYIVERRDKKELALLKDKPKKEKGGINIRLIVLAENSLGKSNEPLEILKKAKKDKKQTALEFQQSNYQKLLSLLDGFIIDNRVVDITNEYKEKLLIINQDHKPVEWLNQWTLKAHDISFATHVAKLTHSSSKSSSVYDKTTSVNSAYLTTNTITEVTVDTATANAASAPAGEILTLQVNGISLLDYVKNNDRTPFEKLTANHDEISDWMSNFKQAYDSDKKNSHFLSKQVYFPIDKDKYHLLMPLVSSSMAQVLFLHFKEFFDDENALIRDQKNKKKYSNKLAVSYPKRASLNVTGSNHSNASSLNGKRGGRLALLANMPPKWTATQKQPKQQTNLLNRALSFKLSEEIKALQRLLLVIKSKEMAMKKPEIHRAIVKAVNAVANEFFDEVIMINLLSDDLGWTKNSRLPLSQQLLLEPNREDDEAIQEKFKKQWQEEVADDFAYWLNKQLAHKKLNLTPIQQRLWKDIFNEQLREFIATQEVA